MQNKKKHFKYGFKYVVYCGDFCIIGLKLEAIINQIIDAMVNLNVFKFRCIKAEGFFYAFDMIHPKANYKWKTM